MGYFLPFPFVLSARLVFGFDFELSVVGAVRFPNPAVLDHFGSALPSLTMHTGPACGSCGFLLRSDVKKATHLIAIQTVSRSLWI